MASVADPLTEEEFDEMIQETGVQSDDGREGQVNYEGWYHRRFKLSMFQRELLFKGRARAVAESGFFNRGAKYFFYIIIIVTKVAFFHI